MNFSIQLVRQSWLHDDHQNDLCSHGEIDLRIGRYQVSTDPQLGEGWSYGISEAALGLLRTLRYQHTDEDRVAHRLIPCGCGTVLMMGCDIGIDWTVRHRGDIVEICDVVRYDTNDIGEAVAFPGIQVPWRLYAEQVTGFARAARAFFEGIEKDTSGEAIKGAYSAFWCELNDLLNGWESHGTRDAIRAGSYCDFHP